MITSREIIDQTKKWILDVVIGCNFCPFAAKIVKQQKVHYQVEESADINICTDAFLKELKRLDDEETIETSFLIFPNSFDKFSDYLEMVALSESLIKKNDFEGKYQIASFHPQYQFADAAENDAANYTNRSIYPMLHLLREESIERALANYESPESIPERNIDFAREKGLTYMKMLRDACFN